MLLDHQLVPETIVRPKSFVGLMALYESNYLRLQQLIPELERIDGCFRSRVAGDCDLHADILERSRYTITLSLSYYFDDNRHDGNNPCQHDSHGNLRIADPDLTVRAYLDGRLAEAMRIGADHRHPAIRRLSREHRKVLDSRWRRNMLLNKWLDYLIHQGHLILDR